MNGFIKLYRSLMDWEWYQDANVMRVFLHLLLDANHKAKRWQGRVIEPGQTVTSRQKIAEGLGLSEQQVRTALTKLKSTGEITSIATNKYTLVTIENWASYQSPDDLATSKTTSDSTNEQPTDNQQITTNKNVKNVRSNIYAQNFDLFYQNYPKKVAKQAALKSWQKLKPDDDLMAKIMRGLERWKQSTDWLKDNGQYIPYPASWLNGRRWEDEIDGEVRPKNYVN